MTRMDRNFSLIFSNNYHHSHYFPTKGWGTQFFGGPHSKVLLEVPVPIWDQQRCVNSFVDSIFDETLCAGGYEGGRDACQVSRAGGPIV